MAVLPSISLLLLAFLYCHRISSSRLVEPIIKEAKEPVLQLSHINTSKRSESFDPSRVINLSWHPRAFLYEGFLSDEECDHLIFLAHGKLEKSMVIDEVTGKGTSSKIRTSFGIFLRRGQDEIITRIEERIATWTFLPAENGEDMQILHYGPKESYEPHFDYYHDKTMLALGGHRIASVLMYLSNVSKGGETIFPMSEMKDAQAKDATLSECAANGYAMKPVKGNALLFFNLHPDARLDNTSLHGGCMVLEGEKWSATKWIHVRAFDTVKEPLVSSDVSDCTDEDDNCPQWASSGECQRNPVYMMGTPDYYGCCRKSCGAC